MQESENINKEKSLAEKCFDTDSVGDELFSVVNKILDCPTFKNCNDENFIWGAWDVQWDDYDSSIEVIRGNNSEFMSPEQAKQIIDLGFSCIFESCGGRARIWYGNGSFGECQPRKADEVLRLRCRIKSLKEELEKLKKES